MPVKPMPVVDRVLARCDETDSGCWEFLGARSFGYGVVGAGGRGEGTSLTHRVTYQHFIGEVPTGLDLDHLCRNRACCNPWHLDPVTRLVNVARGEMGGRTHCVHGHEYTPENTSRHNGSRRCLTCHRNQERARKCPGQPIEEPAHV